MVVELHLSFHYSANQFISENTRISEEVKIAAPTLLGA